MKVNSILIGCLVFSFSCKNHDTTPKEKKVFKALEYKKTPSKYLGEFSVYAETEATTTGMASISYYLTINKTEAILKTNTYHEPIRCNGKYAIVDKDSLIELHYSGTESNCSSDYPDFEIKNKGNQFFIKGVGNEANSGEWVELKKK